VIYIILFLLGVCLASFVNALVWRIHEGKDFVNGRSQCVHCGHTLAARDLVPIFSWLALNGKCRYCRRSISVQYPIVELTGALVFIGSYAFWPMPLSDKGQTALFIGWLAVSVGLLALALYDIKWMLLPNKILYPTLLIAVLAQLLYLALANPAVGHYLGDWALSLIIASGFYFVLFVISSGKWIGFGDVRLGLVTGTVLHKPSLSLLMIFLASILGLVVMLPALLAGKKQLTSKLPYGPFLIVATYICLLWGDRLVDFYTSHIL